MSVIQDDGEQVSVPASLAGRRVRTTEEIPLPGYSPIPKGEIGNVWDSRFQYLPEDKGGAVLVNFDNGGPGYQANIPPSKVEVI
ncbi:MAG: hypothetical protein V4480_04295 [Patescibacteria group bacterium]